MRVAFSCVVDGLPKFERQAFLWAHSLLANARCDAGDLYLHCLPAVSEDFRNLLRLSGVRIVEAEPFAGHPYCNKIQQCSSGVFSGYDAAVLSDCDVFFIAPPSLPRTGRLSGKIVDLPNPPLEALARIYGARGVAMPAVVPVDCALSENETTIQTNLNGGLYAIDAALLPALGERWRNNAVWLLARPELLRGFGTHVDQVAMALTLDEMGIVPTPLGSAANFPVHLPAQRLAIIRSGDIEALHYHSHVQPPDGHIVSTGVPHIDAAIEKANAGIDAIVGSALRETAFRTWRRSRFA